MGRTTSGVARGAARRGPPALDLLLLLLPPQDLAATLLAPAAAPPAAFYAKVTFEYNRHWTNANAVRHGTALTPVRVRRPLAFRSREDLLHFLDDEAVSRVYRAAPDGCDVLVNELIHPVFRFYDSEGALKDVLHVDEELAVFFLYNKHRASRVFLDLIVDDMSHGRTNRALGHVLIDPPDEAGGPLRVRVDAYE